MDASVSPLVEDTRPTDTIITVPGLDAVYTRRAGATMPGSPLETLFSALSVLSSDSAECLFSTLFSFGSTVMSVRS